MHNFSVRPSPLNLSSPGSYLQDKEMWAKMRKEADKQVERLDTVRIKYH